MSTKTYYSSTWAEIVAIALYFVFACVSQCFAQVEVPVVENNLQQLRTSEDTLIGKLNRKDKIYDKEIREILDAWIKYDINRSKSKPTDQEKRFKESRRFIDIVLPMVKEDVALTIDLKLVDATLLNNIKKPSEAILSYKDALSDLEKMKYDTDYKYKNALIALGESYMSAGQKSEADSTFSTVASYPWYNAPEPYFQNFRGLYVVALQALINVRRHDRNALKQIYLPPAFQKELGTQLKEALKEVGIN